MGIETSKGVKNKEIIKQINKDCVKLKRLANQLHKSGLEEEHNFMERNVKFWLLMHIS